MGRWKHAAAVLDAAAQWKQRCLLDGGSLLTDERLWTRACFQQLRTHFVERPDSGSDPFEDKLRRQLDPAPPEAKRLWAEMTWAYDLIANNVKPVTKLDRIRTVWEQSGASLPEDHWALGEVLECGVANPGPDWHRWREFRFIIIMMIAWFSLSDEERGSWLAEPWHFAEWLDGQEESRARQFRHAVLFLLFPDYFERIVTTRHKRDVVKAFRGEQGEVPDVAGMSLVDLDRELLGIRGRLQVEHQDEEVDFYESPFKDVWWRSSDSTFLPKDDGGRADDDNVDHESWYRGRFGEADVWAIAAGEGARLWPDFQEHGIAAIGFDKGGGLGDLSEYDTRETIHRALVENGYGQNPHVSALAAWEFSREMKIGDFLVAKTGRSVILGWGKVTGGYSYEPERPEYRHTRAVEWHPCGTPINLSRKITPKTLTRFSPYRKTLRSIFARVYRDEGSDGNENPREIAEKRESEEATPGAEPYNIALALGELFIDDGQFRRILDSIALRKNLILQGPPGVGKTFIARRIAWCLIGRKDPRPIEMVQFHQSYAYEDFVQGWRPNEHGGFTLRNGVFFDFCKRAAQEPGTPFVFIIDEINRGISPGSSASCSCSSSRTSAVRTMRSA